MKARLLLRERYRLSSAVVVEVVVWRVPRSVSGRGPMTLRAIARLVDRDTKTTFGDVQAILQAGILETGETGEIRFPYDAVHVDFTISKVA